jgi:hypothetical protein
MALTDFLRSQFIDIIEWNDDSRDTLSYRYPDDDKEIKNGAQLIVRESQKVQFVYLGQFGDLFGPDSLATDGAVVTKVLGEVGWEQPSRNIARCYTAQTRQYATPQTELEINKTDVPIGIYWVETRRLVAPGKMGDYLNWLKNEYRPALEKVGVAHFQVSQPIFGAVAGEIVTMRALKNLAEIDLGSVLSRAMSDEMLAPSMPGRCCS